ncbi:MAG TPA: hypothetical protein VG347_20835 [Verrucomicrobiae bacterium]|nr:hypothetical protein [Verrucomicrobiae bacterium]
MTDFEKIQPGTRTCDAFYAGEKVLGMRQPDIKPMLKVLAGLCIFFGAMAAAAAGGAVVVMLIRSLLRLF